MLIGIKVKTINDESFHYEFEHDTKICDIKTKLKESTAITEDRQRLIYKGRVLQDESVIEDYQIEDGHTLHMVARPADYDALRQAPTTAPTEMGASTASTLQTLLALSALSGNPSMQRQGQGAESRVVSEGQSLEAIRQGLLTAHTFLSTGEEVGGVVSSGGEGNRTFYRGQWLDVKDTVNQWLEATVIDVCYHTEKVFVHYHGWPSRWNEWLAFSSDRITPFRTRTANVTTTQASPMPTTLLSEASPTGPGDIRHLIPELARLVGRMTPLLNEASRLCVEDRERERDESQSDNEPTSQSGEAEENYSGMPWLLHTPPCARTHSRSSSSRCTSTAAAHSHTHMDVNTFGDAEKYCTGSNFGDGANSGDDKEEEQQGEGGPAREREQLVHVVQDLSPLLDRLGRAMTDAAPLLLDLGTTLAATDSESGGRGGGESESGGRVGQGRSGSAVERVLESLALGRASSRNDSSPPYRPLVSLPVPSSGRMSDREAGTGRHLDIHIHAIMAPPRSVASQDSPISPSLATSTPAPSVGPAPSPSWTNVTSSSRGISGQEQEQVHIQEHVSPRQQYRSWSNSGDNDRDDADSDSPPALCSDSSSDDLSSDSRTDCPSPLPMMPEEVEQQRRRREVWSQRLDYNQDRDEQLQEKQDNLHQGQSQRAWHDESHRDDIEGMYDSTFGEHFRRLHEKDCGGQGGGSGDNVDKEDRGAEKHSGDGIAMPTTYSQYINGSSGSSSGSISISGSGSNRNRDEVESATSLASLERELSLFASQTQQPGGEMEIEGDKRRKKKNMSFVQRVRRSLPFSSSSSAPSSSSSSSSSTKKATSSSGRNAKKDVSDCKKKASK